MEQSIVDKTLQKIEARKNIIESGHINCIPTPFSHYSEGFVGIEQGKYILITAGTKTGKTQFTLNLLFEALMYAMEHRYAMDIHILYFALEETDINITTRFMSWLLYRYDNIRVSPRRLMSTKSAIEQDIIDKLNSNEYREKLDFFNEKVSFSYTSTPTGIFLESKRYCESVGTVKMKTVSYNDKPIFDSYTQNDENLYNIVVVDHLSLLQEEKGQTKKQAMDKLSELMAKELRNKYGLTSIIIQQQAFATDDNESIKLGRTKPTVAGLADSKYSSRDSNVAIGIYSPFKFNIQSYKGYDITKLKDHFRSAEIMINRDGIQGDEIPLLFDGATCTFSELPPPESNLLMDEAYSKVFRWDNRRNHANMAFSKKIKNIKKDGKRRNAHGQKWHW